MFREILFLGKLFINLSIASNVVDKCLCKLNAKRMKRSFERKETMDKMVGIIQID